MSKDIIYSMYDKACYLEMKANKQYQMRGHI